MHDTNVLLGRAQIAAVFEGNPRMPGFEQHGQHLAPQLLGGNALEQGDLPGAGHLLVFFVALLKSAAVQVVQVGHLIG